MNCPLVNTVVLGDAVEVMNSMANQSVDAIISDPPYPEINRSYGRINEHDWMTMMQKVVQQSKRVLKPSGSAVFILQPNAKHVGQMRLWLWEFLIWCGKEWNIVQDVYWWNTSALPTTFCQKKYGLTKPSLKYCVWLGNPSCYRHQDSVLWNVSNSTKVANLEDRALRHFPSGANKRNSRMCGTPLLRDGSAPFNVIPIANTDSKNSAGAHCHGAGTPLKLCKWWVQYICFPGGIVLDPFMGSGTTALACLDAGRQFIGVEKVSEYQVIATNRVLQALEQK